MVEGMPILPTFFLQMEATKFFSQLIVIVILDDLEGVGWINRPSLNHNPGLNLLQVM